MITSQWRLLRWLTLSAVIVISAATFLLSQSPPAAEEPDLRSLLEEVRRLNAAVDGLNQKVEALARRNKLAAEDGAIPQVEDVATAPAPLPPEPRLPADQLLLRKFADIERATGQMKVQGKEADAKEFASQAALWKDRLDGAFELPASDKAELHAVCFYTAHERRRGEKPQPGEAAVEVTCTHAPVVLCVGAYEPTNWTVRTQPGVRLKQVILTGYQEQQVLGLPKEVGVINLSRGERGGSYVRSVYDRTQSDSEGGFAEFSQSLRDKTGLELVTFQGGYHYPGTPTIVGSDSHAWRVDYTLHAVRPLHAAAVRDQRARLHRRIQGIRFNSLFIEGTGKSYGEFTATGPLRDTLRPIHGRFDQLAVDPRGPQYYGKGGHEVYLCDPKLNEPVQLKLDPQLPEMSWLSAIAFDTKRNRLLASTFAGGGHLYAYEPDRNAWSIVATPGLASSALVYVPSEDLLYGLDNDMTPGGGQLKEIYRFSASGARLATVKLSEPITRTNSAPQLAWAEGRLIVLIGGSPGDHHRNRVATKGRSYVINPQTGEILYSCYLEPQ